MGLKSPVVLLILLFTLITPTVETFSVAKTVAFFQGPKIQELMIKFYDYLTVLYQELMAGEIDLISQDLTLDQIANAEADPNIVLTIYRDSVIYGFAINLGEADPIYSSWRSPTSYVEFRRALAYLVNKDVLVSKLTNGLGERVDAPIPMALDRYINPAVWKPNYPYEYDPAKAAAILDAAGFVDSNGDGIREYPPGHERVGENLDELWFWTRLDDPNMRMAAEMLRDEMEQIGIPVMLGFLPRWFEDPLLWGDWHLYTVRLWIGSPVMLYYLYHSRFAGTLLNFIYFRNQTYDYWIERLWNAPNFETVMDAIFRCQEILVDQAASIWLWSSRGVDAYRRGWLGLVNQKESGVNNYWTFLNVFNEDPSVTQLKYGLETSTYPTLNVITGLFNALAVLENIYDTLLVANPFDVTVEASRPGLARSWRIGTWLNPDNVEFPSSTRLTFYLREDAVWHDGVTFTAYDVNFTVWYVKNFPGVAWNYALVEDVHHVEVPDPYTVEVYMNVSSVWALGWIGALPVLPMHVFGPTVPHDLAVSDPTGYYVGERAGLSIDEALVGTGLFKYKAHDSTSFLLLTANRDYFTAIPLGDVNLDGTVDSRDVVATATAYGTTGTATLNEEWNPAVDLASPSGTIDHHDTVAVAHQLRKKGRD